MKFAIEVKDLNKRFGDVTVASCLSLTLAAGSHTAILGESGCGKTTLLRMLAGLETPNNGEIKLFGKNVARVAPHLRQIAMTFQSPALWNHMTVKQNILFGVFGKDRKCRETLLRELSELLEIDGLSAHFPPQLSGGQAKRVSLARALAARREILLLDEPFSNLDKELKERMIPRLREKTAGQTLLLVTHDLDEADKLCDIKLFMKDGRLTTGDSDPQEG